MRYSSPLKGFDIVEEGRASISAMGSAVLRAQHVRDDPSPWVLEDTESVRLLTEKQERAIVTSMDKWPSEVRASFRLVHAIRARVAEDAAVQGIDEGRRDYVILGAGLDSFSWRHPRARELMIWEIDHPSTQAWKRAALRRIGNDNMAHVRFIPVDLTTKKLVDVELPVSATWNWLGVTMYLSKPDISEVLHCIVNTGPGTVLVTNFLLAAEERDALGETIQTSAASVLQQTGEPIMSTFTREEVRQTMCDAGFAMVQVLDGHYLHDRFLSGRPELQLPSSTVIVIATV
jgi:methyltransferase (TIGR00027 family)